MKSKWPGFHSPLDTGLQAFLDHKRALGCRFQTEEMTLRLFDRFLIEQQVTTIDAISPALVDTFLASRKRASPQSYNHLLQTLARAFQWLVALGLARASPVRAKPRRATRTRIPFLFDPATARKLLEVAGSLPPVRRPRFVPKPIALSLLSSTLWDFAWGKSLDFASATVT